ncbi:MAG: heavy metal-binding domain-containing protein [Ktedonobacterales bacterium]
MITTTLADLPGRGPYEVLGVVIGIANVSMMHIPQGSGAEEAARRQMEARAESMGADAIIDVHLQMEAVMQPPTGLAFHRPDYGGMSAFVQMLWGGRRRQGTIGALKQTDGAPHVASF